MGVREGARLEKWGRDCGIGVGLGVGSGRGSGSSLDKEEGLQEDRKG